MLSTGRCLRVLRHPRAAATTRPGDAPFSGLDPRGAPRVCHPVRGDDICREGRYSSAAMPSFNHRLAICLVVALLGSSCVIVPDQRHYAGGVVMVAPPPPREEVIGEPPVPGYVWLSGYWSWVGDRHEWVPGRWSAPRVGRHWVAHQWVRQGDGWRLKPGHWERG
jgi:hypothetical protein